MKGALLHWSNTSKLLEIRQTGEGSHHWSGGILIAKLLAIAVKQHKRSPGRRKNEIEI
jgi:hypothetical protein